MEEISSANGHPGASPREAQAEGDRLRELVRMQEAELKRQADELRRVKAERDEYRKIIYPPLWKQFNEEQLLAWANDENLQGALQFQEFIGEIEDILNARIKPE